MVPGYNRLMHDIHAVLFDYGLVLSGPPNSEAWARLQRLTGLDAPALHREYWAYRDDYDRGILTADAYWNIVAKAAGTVFDGATRTRLKEEDVNLWTDLNEPMVAWVARLHDAGVRTGILSNIGDAMAEGIRAKFDWIGRFHHTLWSHSLRMLKPEPAIYLAAANGLKTAPQHILFIDDRIENIRAAEAAGMTGIVYASHPGFVEEMQSRGFDDLLHPFRLTDSTA